MILANEEEDQLLSFLFAKITDVGLNINMKHSIVYIGRQVGAWVGECLLGGRWVVGSDCMYVGRYGGR